MENNKNFKIVAIVALCVSIIGVSVAFAALSQDVKVKGTGVVDSANFDIHFENVSEITGVKEGSFDSEPAIINENKAIKYDFTLTAPGDSISFSFEVVNGGDLDAVLDEVTGIDKDNWQYDPVKLGTSGYETDDRTTGNDDTLLMKTNLKVSLVYTDTTNVPTKGNTINTNSDPVSLTLTITYDEGAVGLPTGPVKVTPEPIVFTYMQNN